MSDSPFDLATKYQKYREVKGFGITYLRDSSHRSIRESRFPVAIRREDGVREVTVDELLLEDLRIPPYQRPYSWEPATALQLLDDIRKAFRRRQVKAEGGRTARGHVLCPRCGDPAQGCGEH